jgi:hypothetical protein
LGVEPVQQLLDTREHSARQIVREQPSGGPATALAHALGEGIDPFARDAGADQDRTRDFAVGPAVGFDPRPDRARVDSVHLAERSKHRLSDRLPGASEQRPVDVKQQEHGVAGTDGADGGRFGQLTSDWYLRANA